MIVFCGVGSSCESNDNKAGNLCEGGVNKYDICKLAGVRLSSPEADLTFTAILTGFRNPTRTISPTASLTLALKRPVRRCFGSRPRIFERSSLNPRSRSLSASSRTRTSKDDCGQWTCGEESNSRSRPGVEIKRFGLFLRKRLRSWAGVVVPPNRSCGRTVSLVDGRRFSPSSNGFSASEESAWKARRERRTMWICVASSRVGDTMMAPT